MLELKDRSKGMAVLNMSVLAGHSHGVECIHKTINSLIVICTSQNFFNKNVGTNAGYLNGLILCWDIFPV